MSVDLNALLAKYIAHVGDNEQLRLRDLHHGHKALYLDRDGLSFVDDYAPDSPYKTLDIFWGVYGCDEEGLAMHIVDVSTEEQALAVIEAIKNRFEVR